MMISFDPGSRHVGWSKWGGISVENLKRPAKKWLIPTASGCVSAVKAVRSVRSAYELAEVAFENAVDSIFWTPSVFVVEQFRTRGGADAVKSAKSSEAGWTASVASALLSIFLERARREVDPRSIRLIEVPPTVWRGSLKDSIVRKRLQKMIGPENVGRNVHARDAQSVGLFALGVRFDRISTWPLRSEE